MSIFDLFHFHPGKLGNKTCLLRFRDLFSGFPPRDRRIRPLDAPSGSSSRTAQKEHPLDAAAENGIKG